MAKIPTQKEFIKVHVRVGLTIRPIGQESRGFVHARHG
jgi:preprotein translocase subunit Sss1